MPSPVDRWLVESAGEDDPPTWVTVDPAPPDGTVGGWRYAQCWLGFRCPARSVRCDFEVGTPLRTPSGEVSEAQASTRLGYVVRAVADKVVGLLNEGLADPASLTSAVLLLLDSELRHRVPGARVGPPGSTRGS